jgi:hypothetical protein
MNQQNHSGFGNNIHVEGDFYNQDPQKIMSDLTTVLNELSKKMFVPDQSESEDQQKIVISPESKILYNNVQRFKPIIEDYKMFLGMLSSLYKEYDSLGTNRTPIILENIKIKYIKAKEKLKQKNPSRNEIELIRENADDLIESVENDLLDEIKKSSNVEISITKINVALQVVLIDAFIRCKILERPPEDASAK